MRTLSLSSIPFLLILFAGCEENVIVPDGGAEETGVIALSIPGHPPEMTTLRTILSRESGDTIRTSITLPVFSQAVVATVANVPAGAWSLRLEGVAPDGDIPYSGRSSVAVPADTSYAAAIYFNEDLGTIVFEPAAGPGFCVAPAGGIVSWWPAEYSFDDYVGASDGNASTGVLYTAGLVGKAFRFDGLSSRIVVPDNPSLKLTGSLTIEGWIFAEGYPAGGASGQILFRGDDRDNYDPYFLRMLPDGRLQFHVGSFTAEANLSTPAPVAVAEWHHVAAVLAAGTGAMAIYLDGVSVASTTTTVRPFADLDPSYSPGLGIGNTQSGDFLHNQPFRGAIDELSVYSEALDAGQVSAIFRAELAGKCGPERPPFNSEIEVTTFAEGFNRPVGLIISADGNLLVGNYWDTGIINSVTPSGAVDTFAWGGGREVIGLARDAAGYIYGTFQDGTIKRAAPEGGELSTIITGLSNPAGIAIHPNGNMYVVEAGEKRVKVYSPSRAPLGTSSGSLTEPIGIAIDSSGTVLVTDHAANRIVEINSSLAVVPFISGIHLPTDIAFDPEGRLFVTSGSFGEANHVFSISPAGDILELPHDFAVLFGIAYGPGGNLFVSNFELGTVSKVVLPP